MCFLSSRFHIWWRGCGLLWSTICSHVLNLGFDFLLFSGVIWSPPLCFLKIIGTSEFILDHNLYPVPRFGLLFSFVFWAPCVTYVGEGWVHASVLFSASIASGASFSSHLIHMLCAGKGWQLDTWDVQARTISLRWARKCDKSDSSQLCLLSPSPGFLPPARCWV